MGTMCVQAKPSVPLKKIANRDICFFKERDEPRLLPWQQYSRFHSVYFVMYISGAKFKEHCSIILTLDCCTV